MLPEIRQQLHEAIDRVIDEQMSRVIDEAVERAPRLEYLESVEHFMYRWPDLDEYYSSGQAYRIVTPDDSYKVIVGHTERPAWGKESRRRAVVFHSRGENDPPGRWYPWTEFVETDDGRYAATIPMPGRPRASITELDALPPGFDPVDVARSDELFEAIRNGPSLRYVVSSGHEEAMVFHGYWVAGLRKRR